MGECYTKTPEDGWKTSVPWVKTSAGGWSRGRTGWRKTAPTVWTQFYTADLAAPPAPVLTTSISGTRIKIDVKAPAVADIYRVRVKVGKAVSANNATDANYIGTPDGADDAWSDWLISSGQTRTKYYPVTGALSAGQTYYVTTWAEDRSHNYSTPVSDSIKYVSAGVAGPEPRSATIDPVDSKTFYAVSNKWDWRTDGTEGYLRTGNPDNRIGYLFYSTRVSAILKGAATITSMKIQIQRYPDWDYDKGTQFHLFGHSLPNYTSANPTSKVLITDTAWITMNHGQTLQCTIPSSFYSRILNGTVVGFGIKSQGGNGDNQTDKYCGTFYGQGTGSGRITVSYTK